MNDGRPPAQLIAQLRTLQRGIKLNNIQEHATLSASCVANHFASRLPLWALDRHHCPRLFSLLPDDVTESSQARGKVVKMRLAMYAGVCVAPAPAPVELPSSEHIPLPFNRLTRLPIHPYGPEFHGNSQLLQLF